MPTGTMRLLVRAVPGATTARLTIGARQTEFQIKPLFKSIGTGAGLGAAAQPVWHVATAPDDGGSPWDACHAAVRDGLGATGGVDFAEPDLEQQWAWATPPRLALGMAGECRAEPADGDGYATGPSPFWFREKNFSELADAQKAVGEAAPASRVRIAHLDTGYDAGHKTLPRYLRTDLQCNFVDDDRPGDATDRPTALLNPMYGHGTGTLGLLAGAPAGNDGVPLGGAAFCDVVPVRVANWVVLFRNSAIAQAFDYVHGLWDRPADRVHVVTLSMGGIASAAWADAVNALYDRGIVVVAAAGNNFGNLPTRYIVYPARFRRVLAACGVMADGRPYADLPLRKMAGCYGPRNKEATSVSAYTPNVPWARLGCGDVLDWDGGGTSAATPQIAAAAALWIQKNKAALDAYPQGWMRVEAVRRALFASAAPAAGEAARRLGRGVLRANAALAQAPARAAELSRQDEDSASFGLFRVLTGLGADVVLSPRRQMLELEALQISQQSREVELVLDGLDPGDPAVAGSVRGRRAMEAIADHPGTSTALRNVIAARLRSSGGVAPVPVPADADDAQISPASPDAAQLTGPSLTEAAGHALDPVLPPPAGRALRVYAFDPSLATRLETVHLNEAVLGIDWESLEPGPVGEYFEVIDVDPPSGCAYAPIDLNHPHILAQQGLRPTEGNPQFHQQMVYAVAMKTVSHFERALGRKALWAPRLAEIDGVFESRFVRRLRIYPHALREANAFYSPARMALLFGYFNASTENAGDNLPGGLIFNCLSHDVVAHETTHALLDGLHPRFKEPSGIDMLAFHEAFADIVALFQHFTLPEALREELARQRGELSSAELLGGLAKQFGEGIGNRGALRSAITAYSDVNGRREPIKPDPRDYQTTTQAHARGAILVAAVFDAFMQIYRRRTEDLVRLATGGTGILPQGRPPHDLVERLAQEAATIAGRVLNICIRALDYCPPVDLTFGEYLRALVTADRDLVPDDRHGYRVAFISAFRARGIFPTDVRNLSVDALAWRHPDLKLEGLAAALGRLTLSWRVDSDRFDAFKSSNEDAAKLHAALVGGATDARTFAELGLVKTDRRRRITLDGVGGMISPIEMHSVRPARRLGPDDRALDQVIIEMTQRWKPDDGGGASFRGGCTIICKREGGEILYVIRKRIGNRKRIEAQVQFRAAMADGSARHNYFDQGKAQAEPFAMLHRHG